MARGAILVTGDGVKIYTRTGDRGQTSLWGVAGESRIAKSDRRVEAYGTVDETNAAIGAAIAQMPTGPWADALRTIQHRLFGLGADLSTLNPARQHHITPEDIQYLERLIDQMEQELPPLKQFILPGGVPGAALLHQARTIARRAERRLVALYEEEPGPEEDLAWLNRLSDALFVMARVVNREAGIGDIVAKFREPRPGSGESTESDPR